MAKKIKEEVEEEITESEEPKLTYIG